MRVRWTDGSNAREFLVSVRPGETVAQAVWLSGHFAPAALCSGLGRCGACRVRFLSPSPEPLPVEREVLTVADLAQGVRLGCRHGAREEMVVEIFGERENFSGEDSKACCREEYRQRGETNSVRLAVDLGTTSIHWEAFDDHGCVDSGRELNPQLGAGSDVMSRVAMALTMDGRARLREPVLSRLRALSAQVGAQALCVAGNTAMTAILLDADCSGLAGAPYSCPDAGGRDVCLPGLPPVWIPPQPAPFVGGDVSAGLAAILATGPNFPFLLADMGTNGEFALMTDARTLWLASVPLGPSLEGIGLRCGTMAGPGSVVDFALGPQGLLPKLYAEGRDGASVRGISGTGYLALVHQLRKVGALDESGLPRHGNRASMVPGETGAPFVSRLLRGLICKAGEPWCLPLPHGLELTGADVEEIVKVRAAFSLAVACLLREAGVRPEALAGLYIAGALGGHVSFAALEGLGFVPSGLGGRMHAAGNTSLAGAKLLLREPHRREELAALCRTARVLELVAGPEFMAAYVARMQLTAFVF